MVDLEGVIEKWWKGKDRGKSRDTAFGYVIHQMKVTFSSFKMEFWQHLYNRYEHWKGKKFGEC